MKRHAIAIAALYAAASVVTFGHAAAARERAYQAHCATAAERLTVGEGCYMPDPLIAMFGGALWPLYWSWEAWS